MAFIAHLFRQFALFGLLVGAMAMIFTQPSIAQSNTSQQHTAFLLEINGAIGPGMADYVVRGLEKAQAAKAESRQAEVVGRHAETLSQALYPDKELQERAVGGVYFVARYGSGLLRQLHDAIQLDCHDHQLLEL